MIDTRKIADNMIINRIRSKEIKLTIDGNLYEATDGPIEDGDRVFDTHDMTHGVALHVRDGRCSVTEINPDIKPGQLAAVSEIGVKTDRLIKLKPFIETVLRPIDLDTQG